MFVAAAVCPHPPLLVPELAAAAAGELDELRQACDTAVSAMLDALPDLVVIVGDAPRTGEYPRGAHGSLRPYGMDVTATLARPGSRPELQAGSQPAAPVLPLAHTLGAWLLGRAGRPGKVPGEVPGEAPGEVLAYGVHQDVPGHDCALVGAGLAARSARVGLLVMGDGSARRGDRAPGRPDPDAEAFDRAAATALAGADPEALLDLAPARARHLLAAGRAGWQVLAGAARDSGCAGKLLYSAAPYGVGYQVAVWQ